MEFGIVVATAADSWRVVQRAEELGFTSAWFYDTQMLCADCFVAMGAAAMKTSRIRLGTGVLVPSNRIAPVTANAFATLNQLAPGRIDFGVGTGFTARRAMGMDAIKLAEMEEYIRVVYALLREEIVETELEGKRHKIRFLNPELGLINTRDPIPLYVSAYGPRARNFVAKMGAAWMTFVGDLATAQSTLAEVQNNWQAAGRERAALQAVAFTLGCVLEPGEPYDSPRAMAQAGPRAALYLHRAADEALSGLRNSSPTDETVKEAVRAFIEVARRYQPEDARYLSTHRGHLLFVRPEERPFVTGDLIRQSTFTATQAELIERIGAMRDAGYTQFAVQITHGQEESIEDWAKIKRAVTGR